MLCHNMKYNSENRHRRSIRLKGYDYSQQGYYFVTICTENREPYFEREDVKRMIRNIWYDLPNRFPNIELDEFIIMPNHIHGIIFVGATLVVAQDNQTQRAGTRPTKMVALGDIVGAFKSLITNGYIRGVEHKDWKRFDGRLLQRNYYEHIIRNDESLNRIREYISNNPLRWDTDVENPSNWRNYLQGPDIGKYSQNLFAKDMG